MAKKLFCEYLQEYLDRKKRLKETVDEIHENLESIKRDNEKIRENLSAIITKWNLKIQEMVAYQKILDGKADAKS